MFVCGQIAVDQGFGGIDSKQKALWLIGVVVDFFRDNGLQLCVVSNMYSVSKHFTLPPRFSESTVLVRWEILLSLKLLVR